jgi:hypothetical protein
VDGPFQECPKHVRRYRPYERSRNPYVFALWVATNPDAGETDAVAHWREQPELIVGVVGRWDAFEANPTHQIQGNTFELIGRKAIGSREAFDGLDDFIAFEQHYTLPK